MHFSSCFSYVLDYIHPGSEQLSTSNGKIFWHTTPHQMANGLISQHSLLLRYLGLCQKKAFLHDEKMQSNKIICFLHLSFLQKQRDRESLLLRLRRALAQITCLKNALEPIHFRENLVQGSMQACWWALLRCCQRHSDNGHWWFGRK